MAYNSAGINPNSRPMHTVRMMEEDDEKAWSPDGSQAASGHDIDPGYRYYADAAAEHKASSQPWSEEEACKPMEPVR